MKKKKLLLFSLLSMASIGAIGLTSCDKNEDQPNPDIVQKEELNITGTKQTMTVNDAKSLDLKSLFTIKFNNASIPVTDEMITNNGGFKAEVGSYDITLTYNGSVATSTIKVVADPVNDPVEGTTSTLTITATNTKILPSEVENLKLTSLFKIVEDGEEITVTDEMITNNGGLKAEAGAYEITLKYQEKTATSTVTVYEKEIETEHTSLNLTANNTVVELGDLDNLNLTDLFTITENDKTIRVLNSMIDAGELIVDGSYTEKTGSYSVVLTYGDKTATAVVKVVHNSEVSILVNSDNCVTTKNNEEFDPTSVFSLYIGSEPQKVESDMVDTSKLDLTRTGKYRVTCNFDRFGESYDAEAEVLVLPAVEIQTPNGDQIEAAGVYASNDIFKYEKNFVVVLDGQVIPFEEDNVTSDVVFESNLAQTGEYTATYKLEIGDIEYEKSIAYKIYEHDVTFTSEAERTYKLSEMTADTFNPVEAFNIKVNSSTVSSSNLLFVESSKVAETEPVEGKTIVPYTLKGAIQFGTKGDYELTISFNVDGKDYSATVLFRLVSDVVIKEASSKPVSVFKGASSYDYKTMFTVTKYDPTASYNKDKEVTVTDAMIDASKVDFTTVGEYDVVCTYEDVTYTKKISVIDAPFVGDYQAVNTTDPTTLSITANGVVTSTINSSEGSIEVKEDGSYNVKLGSSSYTMTYDNDVLLLVLNSTNVNKSNCYVFVKNSSDWSTEVMSAYTDGKTSLLAVGDSEFVISKLTNNVDEKKSKNLLLKVTLVSSEYDYYLYDYVNVYSAKYYVNPECTFEGTNDITLDGTTFTFTFTTQDNVTSFTVTKNGSSTTPSTPTEEEVGKEKGTYTGSEGTLTLDGKGSATVDKSDTIVPNYSGISYRIVDDKCILSWKDSNYVTTVYSLILKDGQYTHDTTDDGFKRIYQAGNYEFVNCLGNGIAYAYGIFESGAQYCHYTVNENQLVLTYVVGEETKEITFAISNGDNVITMVDYPEKLYTSKKSFDSSIIMNHKVTVLHDVYRIPQYATIEASDLFKVEFMQDSEVKEMSLNSIVDFSVVDTNELGYQIATLKYQDEKYTYQASAIIYVYLEPYRDSEVVGTYTGDSIKVELNADGTAKYAPFGSSFYDCSWSMNDGIITIEYSSYPITAAYHDGYLELSYEQYSSPYRYYAFKEATIEKTYKVNDKKLYVTKNPDGLVEYYYLDGETFYGEVNVNFASMQLENNVILEINDGGDALLIAQISGSSLILAGEEMGTYTGSAGQIALDGFGNATMGSDKGTYETYKKFYKITINGEETYYTLDIDNKTYIQESADAVTRGESKDNPFVVEEGVACADLDSTSKEVWYSFTASLSGKYKIYSNSDSSSYVDDKGYLYDVSGKELTVNDDKGAAFATAVGGHQYNFGFEYVLTASETYFIKVTISSPKSSVYENYNLNIVPPTKGAEEGTYTGESNASLVLDGFAAATLDGQTGTYEMKDTNVLMLTINGEIFKVTLDIDQKTFTKESADIFYGTWTTTDSSATFILDGFGSGKFNTGYSDYEATYTYDASTNILTLTQVTSYSSNVYVFSVEEDGTLKCTSSDYGYYVPTDSVWSKK